MEFLLNPLIKKEDWNCFVLENGGPSLHEASADAPPTSSASEGRSKHNIAH